MIVDTIFMLAQSASAATTESSEIKKYLLSALISAGVAIFVAGISTIVQTRNTNKSIKAAADNLERTLTHQKESEENKQKHEKEIEQIKRKHELEISKRKFLSEKYEEFSMQLKLIYNWSEELLTTMLRDLGKADYIMPEISSIHGATALSILYFDQFEDDLRALFDHQKNIFDYAYGQLEAAKLDVDKILKIISENRKIPSENSLTLSELRNYADINIQKIGDHFNNMQKIEHELIEKIIDHVKKDAPLYLYTSFDVE